MPTPILTTKLYVPPPRFEIVARPGLVEKLTKGLSQGCKLTLISASAGFGKTTLVSTWAANCRRPVAWLSLDAGDNDPIGFLTYFAAALQRIEAKFAEALLGALQSPKPPPVESILTTLVNEISAIAKPCIFVLDDYHIIDNQAIDDAVTFLLDHLPPQMHLVIATREDPDLPLARLRVRNQMTELRAADLRFTPDEAAEFLNRVMGLNLSAEAIAALEKRTEGWIAGLQLAAISLQGQADSAGFIKSFTGSHHFVLDYLLEEVLQQQSETMQTFLLRTAILDRLCGPLCEAVLDDPAISGQETLQQLDRANLFIVPLDNERRWYRYHHLFADLLRSRLVTRMPDQVSSLHLHSSAWFENNGLLDEAVAHSLAAGDMEQTGQLIERVALRMLVDERAATLSHWIDALPDKLVRTHPWLCMYRAWTNHWIGLREQVEDWLTAAATAINRLPLDKQTSLRGHISAIRAYNMLTSGDLPGVMEHSQQALALLCEGEYVRTTLAIALGGAYWGQGKVLAAQDAFETARANALKGGYRYWSVPSACYVAMQQIKRGLLHEAYESCAKAKELAVDADGSEVPVAGFPNIKMGDLLREWNDLQGASLLLTKGVEQAARLGQVDVLTDGYVSLARLHLAQGKLDQVWEILRKADDLVKRSRIDPFIICWLEDCRVRTLLAANDLEGALRWARESGLTIKDDLSYHFDLHHINLARVLAARGATDPDGPWLNEALNLLERLQNAALKAGWIQEEIKIGILQTLVMEKQGKRHKALDTLGRILPLAEHGGFLRLFVDEGQAMARLISETSARRITPDYCGKLLGAFPGLAVKSPGQSTNQNPQAQMVEPLSQNELIILRLIAQGLSNNEIAERLFLALSTVKGHNRNLFDKLQVQNRTEAVARARELGLL
jgi:LuxR family transcriptional regulator, maltose regulon positive regulatory protein